MHPSDQPDARRDVAEANDLALAQRWLEASVPAIFPPECVVAVQRYDSSAFTPNAVDVAAVSGAVEKRQREFAAGRAAVRRAQGKLGVPVSPIAIGPDRNPLWPTGLSGSITHTAGLALAVVARRERIAALGIDLEVAGAVKEELWPGILTAAETDWIRAQPVNHQSDLATLIFCAKECFFKLQYPLTGTWVEFREAEVSLAPDNMEFSLLCSKAPVTDQLGQALFTGRYANDCGFTLAVMYLPGPEADPVP